MPLPQPQPQKRTLWKEFLSDLSFMLPAFGTVFGLILVFSQSPFLGAGLITLCPTFLALRIRLAFQARRERRRVSALIDWYRRYRVEYAKRQRRIADEMPDVFYCPVPPLKR